MKPYPTDREVGRSRAPAGLRSDEGAAGDGGATREASTLSGGGRMKPYPTDREVGRSRAPAGLRSDEGAAGDGGATREAGAQSGGGPPTVSVKGGPPTVSVKGALLVAGTASDAGKSVVVAGLCRQLARQGVRVAPFKAQNMALNSAVTPGGAEIGRAQAAQAAAAGAVPEAAMNPVLLKPSGERHSQVMIMGQPFAEVDARSYQDMKAELAGIVRDALASLRDRYDVVVCEGAGSPAEINLRAGDLANLGLARAAGLPVVGVGDIDRGGVFASLYGTLALLEPADQALVAGFVINKFRGAPELLDSGLRMLTRLTARPVYGVLPWREGLWLDAEDSLD